MAAGFEVKGYCPGALKPMLSGDGLVVRVRPFYGRLSAQQALGISELSQRFGNGIIDLSSRANVQIRGVKADDHLKLLDGLAELNLLDKTPENESRRNIILTPFWRSGDDNEVIYSELLKYLTADDAPILPAKFGFTVDCGDKPILAEAPADIRIERSGDGKLICRAEGNDSGVEVTQKTAIPIIADMIDWFLSTGGAPAGRGRMAKHLRTHNLPERFMGVSKQSGISTNLGPTEQGFLVTFEFGQMSAETLAELSRLGGLRITPWRSVLIEGHLQEPNISAVITDNTHPLLNVSACTGAPACPQGLSETRDFARALANRLPPNSDIHISGCAKGCAHPAAADMTLVACGKDRFNLIGQGCASDAVTLSDLTTAEILADPTLIKPESA